ncbi:MAG: thiamine-phosphate kinase [Nitrospinota bacterium]|nr:thiamine-phosphate kinase [Nitrospinota bacterium]
MSPPQELEIIAHAKRFFEHNARGGKIALGIGDDCASIIPAPGHEILLTVDTLAEGVHFLRDLCSPEEIGAKAVNTSVSDIAAMGGQPLALLLSVNLHDVDRKWMNSFLKSAAKAARMVGARIIGGNVSAGAALCFSVTAVGEVKKGFRVDRSGAKPGDAVYVTGHPGESALGLDLMMEAGRRTPWQKKLINRHTLPQPRIPWGRLLGKKKIASAMIDVSDGLILDLRRMAEASGVGGRLFLEKIPISQAARAMMKLKGKESVLERMATGGEDYELLFTTTARKEAELLGLIKQGLITATKIGEMTREKGKLEIFGGNGKKVDFQTEGWLHS